jgi:hypothetical protein
LLVVHGTEGEWQLLNGKEVIEDNLTVASLGDIVAQDPTVEYVLNMQRGYEASRANESKPWTIEPE